jgi:Ca2+-binding RTX toxin-like protein
MPPISASAAGESCRGEAATIVSAPGSLFTQGTEARDVIVASGGVDAKGGDDLVCIIGDREGSVLAGAGDDVVDTTAAAGRIDTQLGAGADRFVGGSGIDVVTTDENPVSAGDAGTEVDTVDTGPGRPAAEDPDRDHVATGSRGAVNQDVVTVDNGFVVFRGTPGPASSLTGSPRSSLAYDAGSFSSSALDARTRSWTVDDRPALGYAGFSQFSMTVHDGHQSFAFEGTSAAETFSLTSQYEGVPTVDSTLDLDVRMRGGDDTVSISYANLGHGGDAVVAGSVLQGGSGRDLVTVFHRTRTSVAVDLGRDRLHLDDGAVASTSTAAGFEDATVYATDAHLAGGEGPNTLRTDSCTSRANGRGGRDRISSFVTVIADRDPYELVGCADGGLPPVRGARFRGGAGADVLVGGYGRDHLLGGRGRDVARGGKGRDVCRAEKTVRCEAG